MDLELPAMVHTLFAQVIVRQLKLPLFLPVARPLLLEPHGPF